MRISEEGLDLIKRSEGFVAVVYKDQAGLPPIGYGHLLTAKDKKTGRFTNRRLTLEVAEDLLRRDVAAAEDAVTTLVQVELTQRQFDALVDFTFNLGASALAQSTLLRKLNRGDYEAVPKELRRWIKVRDPKTGELETSYGLMRRRKREIELWLSV
jgi:lysozyme